MPDHVTHARPEDAARDGTPERYARVLGSSTSPDGGHALVLLGMHEPPQIYPYLVACCRDDEGWSEASGANANMWHPTGGDEDRPRGGIGIWDEAPPGARSVTVRFRSAEHRVPVVEGFYFFATWGLPPSALNEPVIIAAE